MRIKSDSVDNDEKEETVKYDEFKCVEMNDMETDANTKLQKLNVGSIMMGLSDAKVDDLYEIYLRSKSECIEKCEELGLLDEIIDELLALFERFEAI